MAAKKTTEKKVAVKELGMKKFSFEIIVSTGAFSNVKSTIEVQADNIDDAISMVSEPIKHLHREFFLMTERRVTVGNITVTEKKIETKPTDKPAENPTTTNVPEEETAAYQKASNAIEAAMTGDALDVILGQVEKSKKLLEREKGKLTTIILLKKKALSNGTRTS